MLVNEIHNSVLRFIENHNKHDHIITSGTSPNGTSHLMERIGVEAYGSWLLFVCVWPNNNTSTPPKTARQLFQSFPPREDILPEHVDNVMPCTNRKLFLFHSFAFKIADAARSSQQPRRIVCVDIHKKSPGRILEVSIPKIASKDYSTLGASIPIYEAPSLQGTQILAYTVGPYQVRISVGFP